jgi:hypothetical protein
VQANRSGPSASAARTKVVEQPTVRQGAQRGLIDFLLIGLAAAFGWGRHDACAFLRKPLVVSKAWHL